MVSSLVLQDCLFVCFNATFNNISDISLRSVLLSGGNRRTRRKSPICRIMLYTSPWSIFELTTSVVIGTDCIGSLKSNYHMITITTTTAPVCSYSSRNKNIKYSLKFFVISTWGWLLYIKAYTFLTLSITFYYILSYLYCCETFIVKLFQKFFKNKRKVAKWLF